MSVIETFEIGRVDSSVLIVLLDDQYARIQSTWLIY